MFTTAKHGTAAGPSTPDLSMVVTVVAMYHLQYLHMFKLSLGHMFRLSLGRYRLSLPPPPPKVLLPGPLLRRPSPPQS